MAARLRLQSGLPAGHRSPRSRLRRQAAAATAAARATASRSRAGPGAAAGDLRPKHTPHTAAWAGTDIEFYFIIILL